MITSHLISPLIAGLESTNDFSEKALTNLDCIDSSLLPKLTLEETITTLKSLSNGVNQYFKHNEFSDYSFTIFDSEFFNIDIYIWTTKHTTIHSHNFEGAFKVLCGSIHTDYYQFHAKINHNDFITEGDLIRTHSEIVRLNDSRLIHLNHKLIHSTIHLEKPTITICIRSKKFLKNYISAFLSNGIEVRSLPHTSDLDFKIFQSYFFLQNIPDEEIFAYLKKLNTPLSSKLIEGLNLERNQKLKYKFLNNESF